MEERSIKDSFASIIAKLDLLLHQLGQRIHNDSLMEQGVLPYVKFSVFFSSGWESVQPDHCVSLYGELILVVLEPKSYLVRAHKLQINPIHDLGLVMGHFMGSLQPTLSPFWILGG